MIDPIDRMEQEYRDRLAKRCTEWQVKNPDEAKRLREEVTLKFARVGKPAPELGSLGWHMLEEAVNEAIRALKGWPTARQFMLDQKPAAPTIAPRPPMKPAVESIDHKSLAAGDR